jgi:hypothetical protein
MAGHGLIRTANQPAAFTFVWNIGKLVPRICTIDLARLYCIPTTISSIRSDACAPDHIFVVLQLFNNSEHYMTTYLLFRQNIEYYR